MKCFPNLIILIKILWWICRSYGFGVRIYVFSDPFISQRWRNRWSKTRAQAFYVNKMNFLTNQTNKSLQVRAIILDLPLLKWSTLAYGKHLNADEKVSFKFNIFWNFEQCIYKRIYSQLISLLLTRYTMPCKTARWPKYLTRYIRQVFWMAKHLLCGETERS